MGTPINTAKPTVPTGPLDVLSAPWASDAGGPLAIEKKPLTAPVASNANRNALRAIVSREI
jgi:hypothetical protein